MIGVPAIRILGIDPGTRRLGFGVIEKKGTRLTALAYGVIDVSGIEPFSARLADIHAELGRVISEFKPVEAAIEQVFYWRNARTAIRAAEGRGAVLLTLALAGLKVHEYAPAVIKRAATGRGGADKTQVVRMVQTLLSLKTPPSKDAADALAAAIAHLHRRGGAR